MIPPLDKIQENLLRFRYIDNSLNFLVVVCENSSSPFSLTVLHKHAMIDLVNFLDHYDSFLGLLQDKEKKLVLSMTPFIEEIVKNKDEIKRTRNKWTAHIINQGDFVKELAKPAKGTDAEEMIMMINGIRLFTKGLEVIFPKQTEYIRTNFTKDIEDIQTETSLSNKKIGIIMNGKIRMVNNKFMMYDCSYQFPFLKYDIKMK